MAASTTSPAAGGRNARRKAATRAAIVTAADRLFAEHGYIETTMDDISREADVAVRTIYLHFDSKPAIFLAYFDDWLNAFVDRLCERPVDEPIPHAVHAALGRMSETGWVDRLFIEMQVPHPTVQFIGDGSPEIAGHIMHSWVRAQERLTADAFARGDFAPDSLVPRARAASVFAIWVATILAARAAYADGRVPPHDSGNSLGERIAEELVRQQG